MADDATVSADADVAEGGNDYECSQFYYQSRPVGNLDHAEAEEGGDGKG